jgi:hypothetical protein
LLLLIVFLLAAGIAEQIVRLPELVRIAKGIDPGVE